MGIIVDKLRNIKDEIYNLNEIIKKNTDFEIEIIDSYTLMILYLISKINEEIDDIMYEIKYIKNS